MADVDYWHDDPDIDYYAHGTAMGYGRVLSHLHDAEPDADWLVDQTGGGCLAIVGQLEGVRVMVTDRIDTLSYYPWDIIAPDSTSSAST